MPVATAANQPADADPAFEWRHWLTLAVIAALILSVLFFNVNVGMGAFLASVVLVLTGAADDGEAIKRMPWRVIVMVCGVTVLIALLERAQGIDLLVSLVARFSTKDTVTGVVAFLTGIISVYSSTSGVVLPAFLPMVPGLAEQLGGASPLGIASAMNIGGHLVDVSPLSTIGALCIAGAPVEDSRNLFNKLLAWGLSMSRRRVAALLVAVLIVCLAVVTEEAELTVQHEDTETRRRTEKTQRATSPRSGPASRAVSARSPCLLRVVSVTSWLRVEPSYSVLSASRMRDLCFEQPRAATVRTLRRLRQLVFAEGEAAGAAAGGFDQDAPTGCAGGADRVAQVFFDVPAFEAQLARDGGHRARLGGEDVDQGLTECH